jgi:hypothetical protein
MIISEFVECWNNRKPLLEKSFSQKEPSSYKDIFKRLVEIVLSPADIENEKKKNEKYSFDIDYFPELDSEKITTIDDGDYQGTLLFLVPEKCYQPNNYWVAKVNYGSCSGCDTFQSIQQSKNVYDFETGEYEKLTDEQISEYMLLALHLLQSMRAI